MKKGLLPLVFFLCLCVSQDAFGQITVTDSSAPSAAENIIYTLSNRSIDVSKTGANTTWDFSGIIATSQDTYKFLAPKDIDPSYATVYNGDLGLDLKNPNVKSSFAFFKTSASDFSTVGLGITVPVINLPVALPYKSPDIVYRFPMKYGNIDSCNYGGQTTILGTHASITGKRVDTVDGWGTVKTRYKTYNCLRIKSVVTEVDTIGTTVMNNNSVQYKWIAATEHIPVFEADVIPNGSGGFSMNLHWRDSYKDVQDPDHPQVDFDATDTNVFVKDTVYFYDKSVGLTSWLWTIIPTTYSYVGGTNNSTQNPKVIFNAIGQYSISLNSGVNTRLRVDYINVTHNTGIPIQNSVIRNLELYPNPSNGNLSLRLDNSLIGKQFRVSLISETGQEFFSQNFVSGESDIALSLNRFAPGLYLVKVQTDDQIYSGKVILK